MQASHRNDSKDRGKVVTSTTDDIGSKVPNLHRTYVKPSILDDRENVANLSDMLKNAEINQSSDGRRSPGQQESFVVIGTSESSHGEDTSVECLQYHKHFAVSNRNQERRDFVRQHDEIMVKVTGFHPQTSADTKRNFFESEEKTGAVATNVNIQPETNIVIVSYETREDADTVVRTQLVLDGCTLMAEHYESVIPDDITETAAIKSKPQTHTKRKETETRNQNIQPHLPQNIQPHLPQNQEDEKSEISPFQQKRHNDNQQIKSEFQHGHKGMDHEYQQNPSTAKYPDYNTKRQPNDRGTQGGVDRISEMGFAEKKTSPPGTTHADQRSQGDFTGMSMPGVSGDHPRGHIPGMESQYYGQQGGFMFSPNYAYPRMQWEIGYQAPMNQYQRQMDPRSMFYANDNYVGHLQNMPMEYAANPAYPRSFLGSEMSGLPGKQERDPEIASSSSRSDDTNPPNTLTKNIVVKVSGYPQSFDMDVLEMYLNNESRFGARVINIDQRPSCSFVRVSSTEEAERVCKKEHLLKGCKLQVEIYHPESDNVDTVLKISGYPQTFDLEYLELYLLSERKLGAKAKSIDIDTTNGCAYVTVSSREDAERVCEREHCAKGCQLTVEIYRPELQNKADDGLVLAVSGYPETFDLDVLEMYLESEAKLGAKAVKIEVKDRESYVTLSCPEDVELVCKREHKLADCRLNVAIYRPQSTIDKTARTVKVSGYPASYDDEFLHLFFESEKKFGAKCEEGTIDREKGCSFVTLPTVEDVEKVCSRDRWLGKIQVKIERVETHNSKENLADSTGHDCNTVKISGDLELEKIKKYIKNANKFGATPKCVESDTTNECVIVTLNSSEDANSVCSKNHVVKGQQLIVELYQPSSSEDESSESETEEEIRIKITGCDSLKHVKKYVKNEKSFGLSPKSIDLDENQKCIFITVAATDDLDRILKKTHTVQGCNLKLELDRPSPAESDEDDDEDDSDDSEKDDSDDSAKDDKKTVRISGYKNIKKLMKYVKNVDEFGTNFQQLEIVDDGINVTLHNAKDVDTVCNKKHSLKGCELKVELLDNSDQCSDSSSLQSDDDTSCVVKVSGNNNLKTLEKYVRNEEKFGVKIISVEVDKDGKSIFATLPTRQDGVKVCSMERKKIRVELVEHENSEKQNDITEPQKENSNLEEKVAIEESETKSTQVDADPESKISLKITGFDVTTMETKIRIYIENKIKFGANAENIEFDSDNNCAYAMVSSKEDATEVCRRSHKVNNKKLHVEVYTPPPDDTSRFLVTNISDETSKDTLINYIESKLDVGVQQILYSVDATMALVEFDTSDTTFEEVKMRIAALKKSDLSLGGKVVKFTFIKACKTIKVDLSTTNYDEEDITNYIERTGEVQDCSISKDKKALITFKKFEDMEIFLNDEHDFKINIHHKCLGEDGGVEDPHVFVQPENVTMEISEADGYKMEFIHQTNSNLESFKSYMAERYTIVEWNRAGKVLLACTLSRDLKDARKLSKKWQESSQNYFRRYLDDRVAKIYKKDDKVNKKARPK